ncbi:hypothetical protein COU57_02075 [Candidatus Pacearchaeota archaeon CG10_big_fil_rev_8_21_14_0_10_32_14]|nr:MAG: hypothetical protein COU57_02075 [Candidatus Pacearchaeota archaeon CG10_big_fil_rev_8_21_14_0_10_32_14]
MKRGAKVTALLVISLFLIVSITSSNNNLIESKEKVSNDVVSTLEKYPEVEVIIKIKSDSNFDLNSFISNLSISDFKFQEKLLRGDAIAGNISKKGLEPIHIDRLSK